ncbi:MAG: hypothetical protein ACREUU_05460 [Gammaproteobacteria bacterium]
MAAIKEREGKRQALTAELQGLDGQQAVGRLDTRAIDRKIDTALADWRQTIRRHLPQARQMARKLLRDRITFTPQTDDLGRAGWRYHAEGSVSKLLPGVLPEFPQAVASPTGFEPVFRP